MTYVGTWQDFTYVAFVTDAFSRCPIGWNVVATLKSDIRPLRTLDVAAFDAGGDLIGLTYHFDHGSNYKALVYTDRIAQLGTMPFTGAVGASYDAMAEAIDALYKTELIRARGPWRTVEQVKLATLE